MSELNRDAILDPTYNPFLEENSIYQNRISLRKKIVNPFKNTLIPNTRKVLTDKTDKDITSALIDVGRPYDIKGQDIIGSLSDDMITNSDEYQQAYNSLSPEQKTLYDDTQLDQYSYVKKYLNPIMSNENWDSFDDQTKTDLYKKAATIKQLLVDDEVASSMYNDANSEKDENGQILKGPETPYKSNFKILKLVNPNTNSITPYVVDTTQLNFEIQQYQSEIDKLKKEQQDLYSKLDFTSYDISSEGYNPDFDPKFKRIKEIDSELSAYNESIKSRNYFMGLKENTLLTNDVGSLDSSINNIVFEAPKIVESLLAGSKFSPLSILGIGLQAANVISTASGKGDRLFGLYDSIMPNSLLNQKEKNDALVNLNQTTNGIIDVRNINPDKNLSDFTSSDYVDSPEFKIDSTDVAVDNLTESLGKGISYSIDFRNILKAGPGFFERAKNAKKYQSFKDMILDPVKEDIAKTIAQSKSDYSIYGKFLNKDANALRLSLEEAKIAGKSSEEIAAIEKNLSLVEMTKGKERIYKAASEFVELPFVGTFGYVATLALQNAKTADPKLKGDLTIEPWGGLAEEFVGTTFNLAFNRLRLNSAYFGARAITNRIKEVLGESVQEIAGDQVRNLFLNQETDDFLSYLTAIAPMTLTMSGIKQSEKRYKKERLKDPMFVTSEKGFSQYQLPVLSAEKGGYAWSTINPKTGKSITKSDVEKFISDEYNEIDQQFKILSANELRNLERVFSGKDTDNTNSDGSNGFMANKDMDRLDKVSDEDKGSINPDNELKFDTETRWTAQEQFKRYQDRKKINVFSENMFAKMQERVNKDLSLARIAREKINVSYKNENGTIYYDPVDGYIFKPDNVENSEIILGFKNRQVTGQQHKVSEVAELNVDLQKIKPKNEKPTSEELDNISKELDNLYKDQDKTMDYRQAYSLANINVYNIKPKGIFSAEVNEYEGVYINPKDEFEASPRFESKQEAADWVANKYIEEKENRNKPVQPVKVTMKKEEAKKVNAEKPIKPLVKKAVKAVKAKTVKTKSTVVPIGNKIVAPKIEKTSTHFEENDGIEIVGQLSEEEARFYSQGIDGESSNDVDNFVLDDFDDEIEKQIANDIAFAEKIIEAEKVSDPRQEINKAESEIAVLFSQNEMDLEFPLQVYIKKFRELLMSIEMKKTSMTIEEAKALVIKQMECN